MREVPDGGERDKAVYRLKLHVSNKNPVFQKGELHLRLLGLFLEVGSHKIPILFFLPVIMIFSSCCNADFVLYVPQDHM